MVLREKHWICGRYMAAVAASATGRNAYFVIVAWLGAELEHGPALIAVMLAAGSIAEFLTANLSGIIADRYERRVICLICDALRVLLMVATILGLALLNPVGVLAVSWVLYAVIDRAHTTALQAMIPALTSSRNLVRINSISYLNMQAGNLLAAVAGGLFLTLVPSGVCLVLPLGCFAFSFWAMGSRGLASFSHEVTTIHRVSLWDRDMLPTALPPGPLRLSAIVYALIYSMGMLVNVLGSALILTELKSTALAYGSLEALWAVGSAAGCACLLGMSRRSHSQPALLLVSGCILTFFLGLQDIYLVMLQMAALGVTYNISRIMVDVRIQQLVSIEALGRRKAQVHSLCVGFGLLTYIVVAVAGNSIEPSTVFGCFGVLMLIVGTALLLLPRTGPASQGLPET